MANNLIEAKTRFTDKKDTRYLEIIDEKIAEIKDWFSKKWPDCELYMHVVFSRNVADTLQVNREIVLMNQNSIRSKICSPGGLRTTLSSITTIGRNTWHIPAYMDKALDGFVDDQKRIIEGVMTRNGN